MSKDIVFMKASLKAIVDTLATKLPSAKKDHVAMGLAEQFNAIIKEVAAKHPEAALGLPTLIAPHHFYSDFGKAPVTYLDLEIMAAQVMNILSALESHD